MVEVEPLIEWITREAALAMVEVEPLLNEWITRGAVLAMVEVEPLIE